MIKILKTTFPKFEIFNEVLVKVGEHEYIYIAEIEFEKRKNNNFVLKWRQKHFLSHRQKMLVNVKMAQSISIFSLKRSVTDI